MTTIPDEGLERRGDLVKNDIAYVGVGTGNNEGTGVSDLGNRVYKAQVSNSNVELIETGSTGEYEVVITVKGGTEVSGGTKISEIGAWNGDPDSGGTLLVIDEFPEDEVEAGHTEEFTVPHDPTR